MWVTHQNSGWQDEKQGQLIIDLKAKMLSWKVDERSWSNIQERIHTQIESVQECQFGLDPLLLADHNKRLQRTSSAHADEVFQCFTRPRMKPLSCQLPRSSKRGPHVGRHLGSRDTAEMLLSHPSFPPIPTLNSPLPTTMAPLTTIMYSSQKWLVYINEAMCKSRRKCNFAVYDLKWKTKSVLPGPMIDALRYVITTTDFLKLILWLTLKNSCERHCISIAYNDHTFAKWPTHFIEYSICLYFLKSYTYLCYLECSHTLFLFCSLCFLVFILALLYCLAPCSERIT